MPPPALVTNFCPDGSVKPERAHTGRSPGVNPNAQGASTDWTVGAGVNAGPAPVVGETLGVAEAVCVAVDPTQPEAKASVSSSATTAATVFGNQPPARTTLIPTESLRALGEFPPLADHELTVVKSRRS